MEVVNAENEKKDPIKFYMDMLELFVIEQYPIPNDIDKYLAALSFYICNTDFAYKYNLPFLKENSDKFIAFIQSSRKKCELLKKIVIEIKKSSKVKKYLEKNKENMEKIYISINDFIISNLNGDIRFCKDIQMNGAIHNEIDDVITIKYQMQDMLKVRSSRMKYKKSVIDFSYIRKLVESILV